MIADAAISAEELSHARDAVTSTRANVAAAREQLSQTVAQIDGTTIANHPQVLAAAAAVRNAALALHRTELTSPVSGVIAKRSVQVGQRVAAGTPLLAVVPLANVWVDANFKEVQLERMRAGQPVTVRTDLYGHQVTYHGRLAGIAAGSGNAFALLPSQNASGNWIKIVQRVPVRILMDPQELKAHPLRVGLSATVRVDLHNDSGSAHVDRRAQCALPLSADPSAGDDPRVDATDRLHHRGQRGTTGAYGLPASAAKRACRRRRYWPPARERECRHGRRPAGAARRAQSDAPRWPSRWVPSCRCSTPPSRMCPFRPSRAIWASAPIKALG